MSRPHVGKKTTCSSSWMDFASPARTRTRVRPITMPRRARVEPDSAPARSSSSRLDAEDLRVLRDVDVPRLELVDDDAQLLLERRHVAQARALRDALEGTAGLPRALERGQ